MPVRFLPVSFSCSVASLAMVVLAQGASAQTAPSFEIGKRLARSRYAYGYIGAAREIADGRVVVIDAKEGTFRLIDLAKGDDQLLGNQGTDAGDYQRASAILPWIGDSLLLYDAPGHQALHLSPSGHIAGVAPFTMPGRGFPQAADATGTAYVLSTTIDTTVHPPALKQTLNRVVSGSMQPVTTLAMMRRDQMIGNGRQAYPFRDAWAVRSSDGLVARVVADTYQVIWYRDGQEIARSGALPDQPIPITPADEQAYKDSATAAMKAMMGVGGRGTAGFGTGDVRIMGRGDVAGDKGAGGMAGGSVQMMTMTRDGSGNVTVTSGGPPDGARGGGAGGTTVIDGRGAGGGRAMIIDPTKVPWAPFPATRPPIPAFGTVAMFDANGLLWVERERPHGDQNPRYDVIAAGSGVVAHVELPANTRLVALGTYGVYVARTDNDGEWLERYALPKIPH
ncbi:MAG: hypothetical protein ACREL5_07605 [Gemmatimonadales bacterium]